MDRIESKGMFSVILCPTQASKRDSQFGMEMFVAAVRISDSFSIGGGAPHAGYLIVNQIIIINKIVDASTASRDF